MQLKQPNNCGKRIALFLFAFFLFLPLTVAQARVIPMDMGSPSDPTPTPEELGHTPAPAPAPAADQPQFKELKPKLQIPIPDLSFSDVMPPEQGHLYVSWISEYIAAVYSYIVGIASIFATAMIMWGGMRWIFAAGDSSKIGRAKEIINNALIGLILALGSYILLYTINPKTVSFGALKLAFVQQELIELGHETDEDPSALSGYPEPKYHSDRELAETDRAVSIDFSEFGKIDANAYRKRELSDITTIVIHNGGYSASGNTRTWRNRLIKKGSKVGTHYTIEKSGNIVQHLGEEMVIGHAPGANGKGIGIEINIGKYDGVSCNSLRRPTADAVRAACTPTSAQYSALGSLIADIVVRTSATYDSSHVIGHCEASGSGGHGDPRAFDWSEIGLSNEEKQTRLQSTDNACSWYLPF